jgi:hypothetical protein
LLTGAISRGSVTAVPGVIATAVPVHGVGATAEPHHEVEEARKQQKGDEPFHGIDPSPEFPTAQRRRSVNPRSIHSMCDP